MLRGNIDVISSNRVAGWVYSDTAPVTGRRILAFAGEHCIGAGEVGVLRPDLRDAGLGDGALGFEIMVTPGAIRDPAAVHVRLDCSDFSLFGRVFYQRLGGTRQGHLHLYTPEEAERVDWMNRQGWLSHEQYTGLRALNALGLHQRTFSRAELAQAPLEARASAVYAEVVSALFRRDVPLERLEIESTAEVLPNALNTERHLEILGVFGDAFEFEAGEGAHHEVAALGGPAPAIVHRNAAHQVLLIHAECLLRILPAPSGPLRLNLIRAPR